MKDLPAQEVIKDYLNRQVNWMAPDSFEGVAPGGKQSPVE